MSAIETYLTYKFVSLLATPWEETDAYELGIIDENGTPLKKVRDLSTQAERDAYNVFHRLVFGLKRLISKVPLIRTKLGTYAAALALIKEHLQDKIQDTSLIESEFWDYAKKAGIYIPLEEGLSNTMHVIPAGEYSFKNDVMDTEGEIVKAGTRINIKESIHYTQKVLGKEVFEVKVKDGKRIIFSADDLRVPK